VRKILKFFWSRPEKFATSPTSSIHFPFKQLMIATKIFWSRLKNFANQTKKFFGRDQKIFLTRPENFFAQTGKNLHGK